MDPNMVINNIISTSADANNVLAAIKDVQQFYQDSFDSLLVVMGIIISVGFIVVGIVVPILINSWQNRNLENIEKNLLDKFKKGIEASKADIKSNVETKVTEVKQELNQAYEEIEEKIKKSFNVLLAEDHISTARRFHYECEYYLSAATYYILAAQSYAKAKSQIAINNTIKELEKAIKKIKSIEKNDAFMLSKYCNGLISIMTEKNLGIELIEKIINIENNIRSIPIEDESSE